MKLLVVLICLASLAGYCTAIECFQCRDTKQLGDGGGSCGEIVNNVTTSVQVCRDEKAKFCGTWISRDQNTGSLSFIRSCTKNRCPEGEAGDKNHMWFTLICCNTNLCNGNYYGQGHIQQPMAGLLLLPTFLIVIGFNV